MVGMLLCHCIFGAKGKSSESGFSQLFTKVPIKRFFLKKRFEWVTYQKIKIKDGIDMEVQENLGFIYFY